VDRQRTTHIERIYCSGRRVETEVEMANTTGPKTAKDTGETAEAIVNEGDGHPSVIGTPRKWPDELDRSGSPGPTPGSAEGEDFEIEGDQ
jgi:hypothetical protein